MPKFQNVAVKGLSLDKAYSSAIQPTSETHSPTAPAYQPPATSVLATEPEPVSTPTSSSISAPSEPVAPVSVSAPASSPVSGPKPANNFVAILIVTIVAILAIAGVGYFAYTTFFK
jgi:hypothetical protein